MKKYMWEIKLGVVLISISFIIYFDEYLMFGNAYNIIESIISSIAFLPIYVLLVTIVIEQLLHRREKQTLMFKLSALIGLFFNEIGRHLLKEISSSDKGFDAIREDLIFSNTAFDEKYRNSVKIVKNYTPEVKFDAEKLKSLKEFILKNKLFLLQLMENPNLFEHESFTDLVLSIFHLYEELTLRESLDSLPNQDYKHLDVDIERAYMALLKEWLHYIKYLKEEYPYLFSVEIRTNPFDSKAAIVIKE